MENESARPIVDAAALTEIASDVWVIRDHRVPLVPNVGIVLGSHSALVVDTGMGPANGRRVLDVATRLAGRRRLFLTLTHFHPEHGYGAQAFATEATIIYNRAQRDELNAKGAGYLTMFRGMGEAVADALSGTELTRPHIVYDGASCEIDLGGRAVLLQSWGPAHTRGDQTVFVPEAKVLFTGDLAEEKTFPIFPWFPPDDADIDAARWIEVLGQCQAMQPAIVVPGHGEIGTAAILDDVETYMLDLRRDVDAAANQNADPEAVIAALKPRVLARYPDWHFPEWIEFAIRTFMAQRA